MFQVLCERVVKLIKCQFYISYTQNFNGKAEFIRQNLVSHSSHILEHPVTKMFIFWVFVFLPHELHCKIPTSSLNTFLQNFVFCHLKFFIGNLAESPESYDFPYLLVHHFDTLASFSSDKSLTFPSTRLKYYL